MRLVLDVALRTIRGFGYDVITALNGPEALDILRGRRVDLVFSDVIMPEGINGYQLAAGGARDRPRGKRRLLTSGYSAGHRPGHNPSLPMLHKPYTRVQLAARIRAVLDERPRGSAPGSRSGTAPQQCTPPGASAPKVENRRRFDDGSARGRSSP